jgi:hypothetical protein
VTADEEIIPLYGDQFYAALQQEPVLAAWGGRTYHLMSRFVGQLLFVKLIML